MKYSDITFFRTFTSTCHSFITWSPPPPTRTCQLLKSKFLTTFDLFHSCFKAESTILTLDHFPFLFTPFPSSLKSPKHHFVTSRPLPFLVRRYGESVKIVHFIGVSKPWHAGFDSETGTYVPNEPHDAHASKHLQFWWQIYHSDVVKDMKAVNKVITNISAP